MWREAPRGAEVSQQAEAQSQVDYSSTKTVPAVRWFLQGASQSNYNVSYCVTELLRYCVTAVSRNRVAALLRLRSALVLCSPRPHREFAVPTTTPTFLPSALSHLRPLRGYAHCVSV